MAIRENGEANNDSLSITASFSGGILQRTYNAACSSVIIHRERESLAWCSRGGRGDRQCSVCGARDACVGLRYPSLLEIPNFAWDVAKITKSARDSQVYTRYPSLLEIPNFARDIRDIQVCPRYPRYPSVPEISEISKCARDTQDTQVCRDTQDT